jgi:alanine dehydrogenase
VDSKNSASSVWQELGQFILQIMLNTSHNSLFPGVLPLLGKKATLLLGTDRHIGEETPGSEETRVGVTPAQIELLKGWLRESGIYLDFYFVQGAGSRAGYSDGDYLNVGGELVFEHELSALPTPNVFHALKEPSPYESFVPGPFIRIGALHTGAFDPTSGLASLFKKKNFAAILDGSNIGGYSFKITGGHAIPIRSSMSVFAGGIAADYLEPTKKEGEGKVVVSGGGVVGTAAVERLLATPDSQITRVIVIEPSSEQCQRLRSQFADSEKVVIVEGGSIRAEDAAGAVGLILTAFRPGHPAPKVIGLNDLSALADKAVIVDVSIDERGGISIPDMDFEKMSLLHVTEGVRDAIKRLGKNYTYIGDSHLPRNNASAASEAHGKAVLPYLAVLLYLSAREGGAPQAIDFILRQDCSVTPLDHFASLVCDLRQGLAFWRPDPINVKEDITRGIMSSMDYFLRREGISWKVE